MDDAYTFMVFFLDLMQVLGNTCDYCFCLLACLILALSKANAIY